MLRNEYAKKLRQIKEICKNCDELECKKNMQTTSKDFLEAILFYGCGYWKIDGVRIDTQEFYDYGKKLHSLSLVISDLLKK